MARFYSDENFPLPVVDVLLRLGHDVFTIFQDGKARQQYPDELVLATATAYQRAVLTMNRWHFLRLHRISPRHGGIILCTYNPDFAGQAEQIDAAVRPYPSLAGQLIRVNRPG
ncbi:MAG: DUF5615 family PIN-like protein [Caldilineaceae bacterium]|jgi:hypothetical protein